MLGQPGHFILRSLLLKNSECIKVYTELNIHSSHNIQLQNSFYPLLLQILHLFELKMLYILLKKLIKTNKYLFL